MLDQQGLKRGKEEYPKNSRLDTLNHLYGKDFIKY